MKEISSRYGDNCEEPEFHTVPGSRQIMLEIWQTITISHGKLGGSSMILKASLE
jgi:hypothetical protein